MTLHDQFLSYLRTIVPYAIGLAAAWVLTRSGFAISDEAVLALAALLTVIFQNAYYMLIRFGERHVPWLGVLIGWPKQPEYVGTSNYWASVIRTGIPTLIGAIAGLLAVIGLNLDPTTQSTLALALIGLCQTGYYSAARWLATKFPALSWLLGDEPAPAAYFGSTK